MKHLLPKGWPRPGSYSNGGLADGRQVHVAGMIVWDETGAFAEGFARQFEQVPGNTSAVLAEADSGP